LTVDFALARFPFARGGYESYYLVAHDPIQPRALWLRYTVHQADGSSPTGFTWLTFFDHDEAPVAIRERGVLTKPEQDWIAIDNNRIDPTTACGQMTDSQWDLRIRSQEDTFPYLPSMRMYTAAIPKTKPISLSPRCEFDGWIRLKGELIDLGGWEGMVGHNWGSEHAKQWVWLHALFGQEWIDIVAARIALGPFTTPWIANGAVTLDAKRYRLGGVGRVLSTSIDASDQRCVMELKGEHDLRVQVEADMNSTVSWDYANPRGGSHRVLHGSNASVKTQITLNGAQRNLFTASKASYELGIPARDASQSA
jgi:hypothetical protein